MEKLQIYSQRFFLDAKLFYRVNIYVLYKLYLDVFGKKSGALEKKYIIELSELAHFFLI